LDGSRQADTERGDIGRTPRTYHSPLREKRAAETRSALLDAAHRLFVSKGWFATGMRDVANEAGVATETLYGHFPSKRVLFQQVVDTELIGDAAPTAIAQRPEFSAIGRGTHAERSEAAARLLTSIYGRGAALAKVIREAAASHEEIARLLHAARELQRDNVSKAVELIIGREPTIAERDGVWALTSPEVYVLLVENSSWTRDEYESWMAETLTRLLPARRSRRRQQET
jgi:AcrR family transcriptional regulator